MKKFTKKGKTYLLRDIPITLWQRLRHRAVDESASLRGILIKAIEQFLEGK
jgi:hypothetical protein